MALWFLPAPAREHSQRVEDAAESVPAAVADAPAQEADPDPESAESWAVAEEPLEDWPPPVPVEWVRPPLAAPEEPEPPPPEEFHFRRTRWGMTIEEVRASEPVEPLRESEYRLVYAVPTLELPSLLTYFFVQGYLVRAQLSFSDPSGRDIPPLSVAQAQRRFQYLREQLRARYGEPIRKTTHVPRNVADLRRTLHKQDELAQQYDTEIAEAEERIERQREILERRFAHWPNRSDMVARGLKPYERDLRELKTWKQEALDRAEQSRRGIRERRAADSTQPLVATMNARWPFANEVQNVWLRLDFRRAVPRLDIRYEATAPLPESGRMDEL